MPKREDDRLYTIEEWKERWGTPGTGIDRHGRALGLGGAAYFQTEPDFCERHPDDEPPLITQ